MKVLCVLLVSALVGCSLVHAQGPLFSGPGATVGGPGGQGPGGYGVGQGYGGGPAFGGFNPMMYFLFSGSDRMRTMALMNYMFGGGMFGGGGQGGFGGSMMSMPMMWALSGGF